MRSHSQIRAISRLIVDWHTEKGLTMCVLKPQELKNWGKYASFVVLIGIHSYWHLLIPFSPPLIIDHFLSFLYSSLHKNAFSWLVMPKYYIWMYPQTHLRIYVFFGGQQQSRLEHASPVQVPWSMYSNLIHRTWLVWLFWCWKMSILQAIHET